MILSTYVMSFRSMFFLKQKYAGPDRRKAHRQLGKLKSGGMLVDGDAHYKVSRETSASLTHSEAEIGNFEVRIHCKL